jgi:GNAT superfamily N-acetyltransferase
MVRHPFAPFWAGDMLNQSRHEGTPVRMTVRRATVADAAMLTSFGRRVYHTTFAPDNNPDDLAAYLDSAYTEDRQRAEIVDPDMDTLLLDRDDVLAAFAQLRPGAGDGVDGPHPVELWRFYVEPTWHGRGVAAELMAAVEDTARGRGAQTLWLGVWERNTRAQAFYRKHGFTVAGSHIFWMGSDPQRDLIMVKALRV